MDLSSLSLINLHEAASRGRVRYGQVFVMLAADWRGTGFHEYTITEQTEEKRDGCRVVVGP